MENFIYNNPEQKADNYSIEILVHFVDQNGKRIKPSSNRIILPLQVSDITEDEKNNFPRVLLSAISSCFRDRECLHRLVRAEERVKALKEKDNNTDCKLLELALFPILDCIEIQETQHSDQQNDLS